ncbi:hypothetical protein K466DRAFT_357444 [Polyporus arcularius HHB13444]|uniref:Uncharacterized protein n=1 Tax=Polyporus arcularius HHB13444 TaxID=1314778 RepID=A0A5C3NUL5_9APHY|nr:hypothetical protein K466DRAFT_357444 [Polyporus arcularius HHB13444]
MRQNHAYDGRVVFWDGVRSPSYFVRTLTAWERDYLLKYFSPVLLDTGLIPIRSRIALRPPHPVRSYYGWVRDHLILRIVPLVASWSLWLAVTYLAYLAPLHPYRALREACDLATRGQWSDHRHVPRAPPEPEPVLAPLIPLLTEVLSKKDFTELEVAPAHCARHNDRQTAQGTYRADTTVQITAHCQARFAQNSSFVRHPVRSLRA